MNLAVTASEEKAEPVHAVARWRALARRSELALILLAVATGVAAAVFVALASDAVQLIHHYCFALPGDSRLSGAEELRSPYFALVPALGGTLLGLTGIFIKRWRPRRPVDAIEANALRGGRMSIIDSILIALQTIVSCGFGASVGLEAGYTQIGAGFGSTLGSLFKMRRADMRALVGCGAAGAIAAAFQAPLTGAFYAFELIIGTYTSFGLAPVIAAAISAVFASRALGIDANFVGHFTLARRIAPLDFATLLVLALVCAAVGIAIMRGVTFVEAIFKRSRLPRCVAAHCRWSSRRRPGAADAACAGVGPRRPRGTLSWRRRRCRDLRHDRGAEIHRFGDIDWLGLPRRPFLRLALSRRPDGQGLLRRLCRCSWRAHAPDATRFIFSSAWRRWPSRSSAAR